MLGFSDLCSFMKTIGIAIKLFHTPAKISHKAIPTNPGARNMFVHFPLEEITLKTSLTKYLIQRYGGKVTHSVSKKKSYIVMG